MDFTYTLSGSLVVGFRECTKSGEHTQNTRGGRGTWMVLGLEAWVALFVTNSKRMSRLLSCALRTRD